MTSVGEQVVLGELHGLGVRVLVLRAGDQEAVERVELLAAVAVDGAAHAPHHGE